MSDDIDVKKIVIKVIPAKIANDFVRRWHYSGKIVPNSRIHFGAFYDRRLHGVMSFGNSIDKRKTMSLVKGSGWNDFIELNRMAFDDFLPKNSESRSIAIALKLLKRNAPQIKWVISYADACQCGTGTIYRAVGFKLTAIKKNSDIIQLPDGTITHSFNLKPTINSKLYQKYGHDGIGASALIKELGAKRLEGYQIRYIYFLDKEKEKDLASPPLDYSVLDGLSYPQGVRHKGNAAVEQR